MKPFCFLAFFLLACCGVPSHAQLQPSTPAPTGAGVYFSPGSNNVRGDLVPLSSAEAIDESFDAAKNSFGATRVLWRGLQEEDYVRHQEFRPDSLWLYDVWQWSRHLSLDLKLNRHAVRSAHRRGMTIWGLTCLFEFGAEPKEAVYVAMEYGPATSEDRLRIQHRDWIPIDRYGIRRQTGPLESAYPQARRALVDRLVGETLRYGYDGLMLLTYVENTDLWFEDEFGFNEPVVREFKRRYGVDISTQPFDVEAWRKLRGEYVTQLLRELSAALHAKGKKLGVAVDPLRPHHAQPWLGNPIPTANAGSMTMDWQRWIREGIVDEIMVGSLEGNEKFAEQLVKLPSKNNVTISVLGHPKAPRDVLTASSRYGWTPVLSASTPAFETQIAPVAGGFLAQRQRIRELAEGGGAALPELHALLLHMSHAIRVAAVVALGKNYDASTPNRIFEAVARYGNFQFNYEATQAISKMKAVATPANIAALGSPVVDVRRMAAEALRGGGKQAILPLVRALKDNDAWVRWTATIGLGRIGGEDAETRAMATRALLIQMQDSHPTVRAAAASALGDLYGGGRGEAELRKQVLARLTERFNEYRKGYRGRDAGWGFKTPGRALQRLGADGEDVLKKILQGEDAQLADYAWRTLYLPPAPAGKPGVSLESAEQFYRHHPLYRSQR